MIYDLQNYELPVAECDTYKEALDFLGIHYFKTTYTRSRIYKNRYSIIRVKFFEKWLDIL